MSGQDVPGVVENKLEFGFLGVQKLLVLERILTLLGELNPSGFDKV